MTGTGSTVSGRPATGLGRVSAWLGWAFLLWLPLAPMVRTTIARGMRERDLAVSPWQLVIAVTLLFGVGVCAAGWHAVVRLGERSWVLLVPLVATTLITLLVVAFAAGEVIAPH